MPTSTATRSQVPEGASTLVELLTYRAEHDGDRTAYTFLDDGETISGGLTFQQLDAHARSIAAVLRNLTGKGERVLLLYPPGLEFIKAYWACLFAGVVAVPLYPPRRSRPDRRIPDVAKDARATLALSTVEIVADLQACQEHAALFEGVSWCATDEIRAGDQFCAESLTGNTLAFLQYTSGSTSAPKGVMVSHANLLENLANLQEGWHHSSDSVMVTWLPTFHDMGLIYGVLQPVFNGFSCYAMPPAAFFQRPLRWLQMISRFGGTHSGAPNFAYDHCVRSISADEHHDLDLSTWCMALNGAEPVRESTLQRFAEYFAPCGFRAETFCPGYGLAEATLKVTATHDNAPVATCCVEVDSLADHRLVEVAESLDGSRTLVGCGPPSGSNRIAIVDPESFIECSPDRVGEIWVSGPTVAQGYWNRAEETAETFRAFMADTGDGPFLRTGDLGFLRDGHLYVTGRIKDLIILQGANVYPQDLELTVEGCHASLRPTCGAAFSVEVTEEERLVVVQEIERSAAQTLDSGAVIGEIRRAVAEEHAQNLHAVVLLQPASIFKSSSGKIQRRACRKAFLEDKLKVVAQWRAAAEFTVPSEWVEQLRGLPADERKSRLVAHLRSVIAAALNLGSEPIPLRARFVDLGVESSQASEISLRMRDELGLSLPATLVFDYPTLEAMVEYLDGELFAATKTAAAATDEQRVALDRLSAEELADLLAKETKKS